MFNCSIDMLRWASSSPSLFSIFHFWDMGVVATTAYKPQDRITVDC